MPTANATATATSVARWLIPPWLIRPPFAPLRALRVEAFARPGLWEDSKMDARKAMVRLHLFAP